MTTTKAKSLLQIDHHTLNEAQLQRYTVQLLDAWRYAKGDYGYGNDFFIYMPELRAFVPKEKWLLKNIEDRLNLLGL